MTVNREVCQGQAPAANAQDDAFVVHAPIVMDGMNVDAPVDGPMVDGVPIVDEHSSHPAPVGVTTVVDVPVVQARVDQSSVPVLV